MKPDTLAIVVMVLCLFSPFAPDEARTWAAGSHGDGCACPEASPGWVVYPDSARGAPDCLRESSIQVHEIVLCGRSVHFLFRAKQAGERREACLVIAEPTLDQSLRQLPADSIPSDADFARIAERLEWDRSVFGERLTKLRVILQQPASGNHRTSFKTGWFKSAPRIHPGAPIKLRWDGQSVELIGIPDVYFRE